MRRILAIVLAMLMAFSFTAMAEEQAAESVESGWENILLLGGDARNMSKFGLTDTIIILSVNREEGQVKMTSIMRDTWIKLPGMNKSEKINAAAVYGGPEMTMQAVNEYFGLDIEHYIIVNMEDLVEIVDALGGVDIEITEAERKQINREVEYYAKTVRGASAYSGDRYLEHSGEVHLNGIMTVAFCRIRKIDNDYNRVMRQQTVLLALAENAQNMDVDELMDIAGGIFDVVTTNMDKDEVKELAMVCMTMDVEEVEQFRVPADGTFDAGMFSGTWMIKADFDQNRVLLHDFIYGEE